MKPRLDVIALAVVCLASVATAAAAEPTVSFQSVRISNDKAEHLSERMNVLVEEKQDCENSQYV